MRRLLTSWVTLTIGLLVLCAGTGVALQQLQRQVETRAQTAAAETADIVAALAVHRNVDANDVLKGTLTATERGDIDADVAVLHDQGRIVGLEVWRVTGPLIYADPQHPVAETLLPLGERQRAAEGLPWVTLSNNKSERGVPTLDVFLPYQAGGDSTADAVVEVLIPQAGIATRVQRSTRQLNALGVTLILATIGALLLLRRRMLAREHQSRHDPLTGLLTRAALQGQIQRALLTADAEPGHWAALLMLDLDGFKAVNDTLGHPAGDELLRQVAQALRANLRADDVVARLGGDEFAVLLTHLPEAANAEAIAINLLDRIRDASYTVLGVELGVDASIGIVLLPEHGRETDVLLQRVDVAMYLAKDSGTSVVVYDEANDPHDVAQLGLLAELRRAIENDELVLHYQPKARLDTGDLAGVEALVRWQHPTRGLLAPDTFIPIAENTGLMLPLTEWVMHSAVEQAARWHGEGLMLPVAVNVSPRSLLYGDLPGTVLRLLADAGLPADLLELEITETAIMTDPERAVQVLRHLNALGVRIAIDDFGTGYTSLSHLKRLPVQTLKIDRAFVAEILHSHPDEAIVESIISLGHKLGMSIVAEGIETEDVWQRLAQLDCDQGQGYHLARPMHPDALSAWMVARIIAHSARA